MREGAEIGRTLLLTPATVAKVGGEADSAGITPFESLTISTGGGGSRALRREKNILAIRAESHPRRYAERPSLPDTRDLQTDTYSK